MSQTRKRGQRGFVREESGQWRGYFNIKILDPITGKTKYKQVSKLLGPVEKPRSESELKAYEGLRIEIQKTTGGALDARPDPTITLQRFAETRWLPLREAKLRPSSKASTEYTLGHIYAKFGSTPLEKLDKVEMQTWLNGMAKKYAKSVVLHSRFYLKSILAEAVEQDYIRKSPASKLESPRTKKVDNDILSLEKFQEVMAELESKIQYDLLVRVDIACAFRPSELFALRWRNLDVKNKVFRITETIYKNELRPYTKTTEEDEQNQLLLTVPVPDSLVEDLIRYRGPKREGGVPKRPKREDFTTEKEYMAALKALLKKLNEMHGPEHARYREDDDFIFANKSGGFMNRENVLHRVFKPIAQKVGLPTLNFQMLRRTAATLAQGKGSVKDVQSLLRHKNPDTTASTYMQSVPESVRRMTNEMYEGLTKTAVESA
jgi:integrase